MTRRGWGVGRLTLALWPLGAGAMAVNLFFASLIGSWVGGPVLSPTLSVLGGMVIGVPTAWAFARHFRRLMDAADRDA
ncbi:MAG: hypothetical protein ACJAVR_002502 [Paracoccaceae bacterium]|jgi:hypothetical protein